jgi:hypothetical protein
VIGEEAREFLERNTAMPQEARRTTDIESNDARLHANIGCVTEQDCVDAPIELFEDMVGGGGGESPKAIRTWRSDRRSSGANEGKRRLVSWQTHAHRFEPGTYEPRNFGSRRGNDREWPWPEGIREDADARIGKGTLGEKVGEVGTIGDVHDERIKGGATLRLKDACDGGRIEGIGTESVDRLGRECD